MSAITPSLVSTLSNGNGVRRILARFTAIADGDTWASGLPAIVSCTFTDTDNPTTQGSASGGVVFASGTFTFYPAEDAKLGDLIIETRS